MPLTLIKTGIAVTTGIPATNAMPVTTGMQVKPGGPATLVVVKADGRWRTGEIVPAPINGVQPAQERAPDPLADTDMMLETAQLKDLRNRQSEQAPEASRAPLALLSLFGNA